MSRGGGSLLDRLDRDYQELIARVDDHIDRLTILEQVLTEELSQQHIESDTTESTASSTQDSSDVFDGYITQQESDDDSTQQFFDDPGIISPTRRRRVHFNQVVMEIDSNDTVEQMYTPFDAMMDSDEDSDTDTVVLEYEDPHQSPDVRFLIHRPRYHTNIDNGYDSDDDI